MNNKIKTTNVSVGAGGTLLLTVFVILCLMIFAVLSFITANSDLKFSLKTQEVTEDYYRIHGLAEEKLAVISDMLTTFKSMQPTEIVERLSTIEGVSLSPSQEISQV